MLDKAAVQNVEKQVERMKRVQREVELQILIMNWDGGCDQCKGGSCVCVCVCVLKNK